MFVGILALPALFAVLRFGLQEIVTKQAIGFTLLGLAGITFWWNSALLICGAMALLLLAASMFSKAARQGIAMLTFVVCLQPMTLLLPFSLQWLMQSFGFDGPTMDHEILLSRILIPLIPFEACFFLVDIHRHFQKKNRIIHA